MAQITKLPQLPARPIEGHKGMFGRVLIVGGNDQMVGAPVLAGTSALRMGAGLVQIAVPRSILAIAISITPELIGMGLGKGAGKSKLLDAAKKADAVVIGPGLGQSPEARERLMAIIRLDKPMVIDADGLNMIAEGKSWPKSFRARAVLTPHPGEMKRLARLFGRDSVPSDEPGRIDIATTAARTFGQVVVLKGYQTVISDGNRVHINDTGDSSLSKAGTGDVLSGMIGTLLAEKMDGFDAACAATWIHGHSGELAGKRLGRRCVIARDVIDGLHAGVSAYEQLAR